MKLIKKYIERDGSGNVTLRPEDPEDLWQVYNMIIVGDQITAKTFRKIHKEGLSGATATERVKTRVTIQVNKVEFDPGDDVLRVSGPCVAENLHIKLGAHHTLEIILQKTFTLIKPHWDIIALDRLADSCDPSKSADVAAVLMSEGLANILLVTGSMSILCAKVETSIPRKRKAAISGHDKAVESFFANVLQAVLRHINFEVVKVIIVASPGFVREQFMEFLNQEAQRKDIRVLIDNKGKFLQCHSSSGHKHALREILANEGVATKLADTKAAGEVKALNSFYEMLKVDPDRAYYGLKPVLAANDRIAVRTLLLTDELFRAATIASRKQYVGLVDSVKQNAGEVKIFSTLHPSGEQLALLGGIAAILKFPLPNLEDLDDENNDL